MVFIFKVFPDGTFGQAFTRSSCREDQGIWKIPKGVLGVYGVTCSHDGHMEMRNGLYPSTSSASIAMNPWKQPKSVVS